MRRQRKAKTASRGRRHSQRLSSQSAEATADQEVGVCMWRGCPRGPPPRKWQCSQTSLFDLASALMEGEGTGRAAAPTPPPRPKVVKTSRSLLKRARNSNPKKNPNPRRNWHRPRRRPVEENANTHTDKDTTATAWCFSPTLILRGENGPFR